MLVYNLTSITCLCRIFLHVSFRRDNSHSSENKMKNEALLDPFSSKQEEISLRRDLGWNSMCSRLESHSSGKIFAWERPILAQARFLVKKIKLKNLYLLLKGWFIYFCIVLLINYVNFYFMYI